VRLIDADSFLGFMTALEEAGAEHISFDDLKKFISEQRTAYDMDKVVRRIKDIPHGAILNVEREHEILDIVCSGGVGNSD